MPKNDNIAVIDLFCGIGGLSQGFVMENFNVVSGYDNDVSCRYTYETNNKAIFHNEDVSKLDGKKLNNEFGGKLKILVGCAPCQPFSPYSFRIKDKDPDKMNLLYSFFRLVEETQPTIVSMENVPQLVDFSKFTIFKDFHEGLKLLGYFVSYQVVFCPDYGIPQRRRRLVLLASKLGEISLIPKTHIPEHYVTVKNAIGDLEPVEAGEYDKKDPLHRARKLSDLNLKRIRHTKEGEGWKSWPKELVLDCFKKPSGQSYGSVYGRMKWDEPAPTMTTHCTGLGNGRFGHPEQDRAITLREAALFQTFPMDYKFYESLDQYNPSVICKQIGNAVPPKLGQVIAKSIKEHLIQYGKI
ncbi:DNA (cytosine-5)-methyltransferase 1 [termite gut metagenome]|uniref:DNA (cytosine-5-)-methyltransferase n=1 Tax=termite gut metagenome TaxID=433724 RepID=A0A5J4S6K9_9ZZZZ